MRLIDADKLKETIHTHHYILMFTFGIDCAIDEQPTVEAEPVKHGHWVAFESKVGHIQYCSSCGIGYPERTDYCPHCGAKMVCIKEENNDYCRKERTPQRI